MKWLGYLALFAVALAKVDYTGYRLISARAITDDQAKILKDLEELAVHGTLDFWSEPTRHAPTDFVVSPSEYQHIHDVLQQAGIAFSILRNNVQELFDEEFNSISAFRSRQSPEARTTCNHRQTYCDFNQIETFLSDIETQFPNNVAVSVIGTTYEGRSIYQVKIAKNMDVPKEQIWIETGTHAREHISVSSGLDLIYRLAHNADAMASLMLDNYDWYIVPVHNPDGYVYTWTNDRLWRKNRQPCTGWGQGVDLNRNWGVAWGSAGTSSFCSSDTYGGTGAFSALETTALRNAVLASGISDVTAFFSIHCYSQFMLVPYAYTSTKPTRYQELFDMAEEMMKQLETVNGTYFLSGTPPDILYAASGGAYDYFYEQGVPWSYTYELRPASGTANGFVLPASQIPMAVDEVFVSLHAFVHMLVYGTSVNP